MQERWVQPDGKAAPARVFLKGTYKRSQFRRSRRRSVPYRDMILCRSLSSGCSRRYYMAPFQGTDHKIGLDKVLHRLMTIQCS